MTHTLKIGFAALALSACTTPKTETDMPAPTMIAAGTNKAFSHTQTTTAPPDAIWALWTDVSTWKAWDKGLKDAVMKGPMQLGANGTIVSLSGPNPGFKVTEYNDGVSYAFVTNLPLAKLTVRRTLLGTQPTTFRHDVSFSGLFGGVWASRFGPTFRAALPPTMEALAALAEAPQAT